ncbi:transcription initiation factor TFIID [Paenibacillus sp. MZ03-122A]|uniref:transcription initiation factor TFIID n=1 Tax=Paenibacillus sp. MZ03-122A TaxID=2962033 RepID=UPI0020B6403C|nr:transcription initiation factor TFIID [Paenibacillus sp. MZ03-122A]MCP3780666.1 transcription initiation factor TFIID [Paenibacillus sp. MZ03-122A]
MREQLLRYAADYAAAEDQLIGSGDGRSSIHFPSVFLFIGDRMNPVMNTIADINRTKWDNSTGVTYIQIRSQEDHAAVDRSVDAIVHTIAVPEESGHQTIRRDLHQAFYTHESQLIELNTALRRASGHLADYGRLYSSFERVHLSILTTADDPMNVLIPEITLLAEYIFAQSFKSVQMDLYVLVNESDQAVQFGYSSATSVAFMRELDYIQSPEYTFTAPLHMTEDKLTIPVTHAPSPLFDLVYVLSDKNERGVTVPNSLRESCDIICHIQLLKNRYQAGDSYRSQDGGYNNTSFKNNIMTESGRQGYVSAGFSRVNRPNQSIALTVLYHFYVKLLERMRTEQEWDIRDKLNYFGLDAAERGRTRNDLVPGNEAITDMSALMTSGASYGSLKRMTLREAEEALFGQGCEAFFRDNCERIVHKRLGDFQAESGLQSAVNAAAKEYPEIGLFELTDWTDENKTGNVLTAIRGLIRDTSNDLQISAAELDTLYSGRVEDQPFQRLPLMDKHNVRSLIRYLTETVYGHKLHMLRIQADLELLRRYELALEKWHAQAQHITVQLSSLERELHQAATDSIRQADSYTGQNLFEYYERVTEDVMRELESKRGKSIFFDTRHMGPVSGLLDGGLSSLVDRLTQTCRTLILSSQPFNQTFEEELLRRANVAAAYENRLVVPKDELFKKLYQTLEEHGGINVRLLDYTHEHRYEEKYFFGDYEGEFLPYAMDVDITSRIYKLGFVHERRSSGVEKLHLMGGFHLEDLMVYRNGKTYYETYTANGFVFHGIDVDRLPELR